MKNDLDNKKEIPAKWTGEGTIVQLIVFQAGNEEFGVPIAAVREIIKMGQVTRMPNLPVFIKGIINVRGEIVTAIDVKSRFSLHSSNINNSKHIIVTKQADGLFGLIVDEVIEVLRLQMNEIQPPPNLVTKIHKKFISGVVTQNDRLIILLDIEKLLSQEELMKFSLLDKKNKKIVKITNKKDLTENKVDKKE